MKNGFFILIPLWFLIFGGSFSSQTPVPTCTKIIDAVQLDDNPTTNTSSALSLGGSTKISFLVSAAETDPGGTVDPQATFSLDLSPDNSAWFTTADIIFDGSGTDAPVSAVTKNPGDGTTLFDFFYLPQDFTVKYARLKVDCSATVGGSATCDADELLVVSAWACVES